MSNIETVVGTFVVAGQLEIGDVVDVLVNQNGTNSNRPFASAVVKYVDDKRVTFFRPYVHTADFICTAGIICYTGTEEFSVCRDSSSTFLLQSRQDPEATRKVVKSIKLQIQEALDKGNVFEAKRLLMSL